MLKKGKPVPPSPLPTEHARRGRHHYVTGGLTALALGLFAAAAALAVVQPGYQAPPSLEATSLAISLPDDLSTEPTRFSQPFIDETQIRPGDTLSAILQRLDIDEEGLQAFLTHDPEARSIYKLYPGRTVRAALDQDGRLVWLRYYHTPGAADGGDYVAKWLEVKPSEDGKFVATEEVQATETGIRVAEGRITNSLFGATDAAGIPDSITLQMADILASKIDFLRDLRKDDEFRIVYETQSHNGKSVGAGRILALEFHNNGKEHQAVWFAPEDGPAGYYDFDGKSLRGAFLRNALKFSRISSTFGVRKHPIHNRWMGHKGVDYAARTGTPIHATADGTVDFIGNQRGYGKTIILKHHGKFTTLYAHQSRFAAGLKKGDKVQQGQVIGYVGATGWATGPHLHYEFRVANKPMDPLSVDLPVARALEGKDKQAFKTAMAGYQQQLQVLRPGPAGVQLASR